MKAAKRTLLSVLVLCLLCTNAHAQTLDSLSAGTRVRLQAKDTSGTFVIEEIRPESIVVRSKSGASLEIVQRENIERLETAQPVSRGSGAKRGVAIGIAAGVAGGFLIGLAEGDDEDVRCEYCFGLTAEERGLLNAVVLGGAGALVGSVIGLIWPGTKWQDVDLKKQSRIEWRLNTAQGLGVDLSFAF